MTNRIRTTLAACSAILILTALAPVHAQEAGFAKTTIDFGVVVSNLEKSLAFYTDVIGFKRAGNFTVAPEVANDAGLTQVTKPITIEMLKLGDDKTATTLKLMQISD
ncbi:MAG: hypothetical protein ACI9QL_001265, partial [Candidatus Omnitrophota bacterium]